MKRLDDYKAALRAKRAAARGMTLEQYDAHVAREQDKLDAVRRFYADREACHAVIALYAERHGRTWSVL